MVAADLVAGGACGTNPCSPNLDPQGQLGSAGPIPEQAHGHESAVPQHAEHAGQPAQPRVEGQIQVVASPCDARSTMAPGAPRRTRTMTRNRQSGMALVSTLLVMMLMSALLVGLLRRHLRRPAGERAEPRSDAGVCRRARGAGKADRGPRRPVHRRQLQPDDRPGDRADHVTPNAPGLPVRRAGRLVGLHHHRSGDRDRRRQQWWPIGRPHRADHPLRRQRDGTCRWRAALRCVRSPDAAGTADGRCARVPVRDLLRERPQLLRRPGLRLRRAESTRTRTSTSLRTGRRR